MSSYTFDIESFISEVQKHPEIWDTNCAEYRLKNRKIRAWGEVAKIFINKYVDMSVRQKNDVNKKLLNKWRNIRDSYVRHVKRNCGKKGGYLYAKQLSFLSEQYKTNFSGSEEEDRAVETQKDNWSCDQESKLKKLLSKSDFEIKEVLWENEDDTIDIKPKKSNMYDIEFVEANFSEATSSVVDEDKSFFDSLLPAIKYFTVDQKLEFRSDVIKLIRNYRKDAPAFDIKKELD